MREQDLPDLAGLDARSLENATKTLCLSRHRNNLPVLATLWPGIHPSSTHPTHAEEPCHCPHSKRPPSHSRSILKRAPLTCRARRNSSPSRPNCSRHPLLVRSLRRRSVLAGSPSALRRSSAWPLVARSGASTVAMARPRQLQRQRSRPPRPLRSHRRPLRLGAPARLRHPRRPPSRRLSPSPRQNQRIRSRSGNGPRS